MKTTGAKTAGRRGLALGLLLSLALLLGLMPGMSLTAYADDPYASLKNTTTVVYFDRKEWYLIDYDSSTVTLLPKECIAASLYGFNGVIFDVIKTYYNDSISTEAKAAVSGDGMFLLTMDQADQVSIDVRKCPQAPGSTRDCWWLDTLGYDYGFRKAVNCADGTFYFGSFTIDGPTLGVRPALKLNLGSVNFSSVKVSGGANATASGGGVTQCYFNYDSQLSAITTVTFTAKNGYMFPETSDFYTTTTGITVTRTSDCGL